MAASAAGRYRGERGAAALLRSLPGRSAAEDATGVGVVLLSLCEYYKKIKTCVQKYMFGV